MNNLRTLGQAIPNKRFLFRSAVAALVVSLSLPLAGCYLPDQFRSEVRINRAGDFAITYEGDLVYAPLYAGLLQGKVPTAEESAKSADAERDLKRDSGFQSVTPLGKGRFSVKYERQGRVGSGGYFTFIRRNADILSIKSTGGIMTVKANAMSAADGQQVMQLGLSMRGEFRVTTDAAVIEHNAGAVRNYGGYTIYIWEIDNPLSPSPRIVLQGPAVSG